MLTYRTYLDIALTWTCGRTTEISVQPGRELRSHSGYSLSSLLAHFWILVLSSGTRPLRFITALGGLALLAAIIGSSLVVYDVLWGEEEVRGWASTFVVLLGSSGLLLFLLGILAEYIGALLSLGHGRPPFVLLPESDNESP